MKEGYKKTEVGVIPEDWEVCLLSGISEINPRKELLDSDEEVSFIAMEQVSNSGRILKVETKRYEEVSKGYTPFKNNDVLLAKITPCFENGKRALVKNLDTKLGFGSTEFHVLRSNDKSLSEYLYYCISAHRFRELAQLNMTGSAGQKRVPTTFIKEYKLPVPPLKEQEKIAEILSTVDCQIDDTEMLIEKCRVLKKGLMQRLLTKGIGHSEFKKTEVGEIPVGWEVKRLGDISIGKGQYGIGASATDYNQGDPRYLRITDIGDSGNLLHEDIKGLDDDNYADYILEEGDIVFARTGNTTGKTYVYSGLDGNLVYAGFLIRFKLNSKLVLKDFVKYVVQTKRYWDWVKVMSTRSGQPGINSNEYSDFKLQLPSLEEQKKISDILLTLDNEIIECSYKKQELELLKKGLMQQLLTGNKRVYNF